LSTGISQKSVRASRRLGSDFGTIGVGEIQEASRARLREHVDEVAALERVEVHDAPHGEREELGLRGLVGREAIFGEVGHEIEGPVAAQLGLVVVVQGVDLELAAPVERREVRDAQRVAPGLVHRHPEGAFFRVERKVHDPEILDRAPPRLRELELRSPHAFEGPLRERLAQPRGPDRRLAGEVGEVQELLVVGLTDQGADTFENRPERLVVRLAVAELHAPCVEVFDPRRQAVPRRELVRRGRHPSRDFGTAAEKSDADDQRDRVLHLSFPFRTLPERRS